MLGVWYSYVESEFRRLVAPIRGLEGEVSTFTFDFTLKFPVDSRSSCLVTCVLVVVLVDEPGFERVDLEGECFVSLELDKVYFPLLLDVFVFKGAFLFTAERITC